MSKKAKKAREIKPITFPYIQYECTRCGKEFFGGEKHICNAVSGKEVLKRKRKGGDMFDLEKWLDEETKFVSLVNKHQEKAKRRKAFNKALELVEAFVLDHSMNDGNFILQHILVADVENYIAKLKGQA